MLNTCQKGDFQLCNIARMEEAVLPTWSCRIFLYDQNEFGLFTATIIFNTAPLGFF